MRLYQLLQCYTLETRIQMKKILLLTITLLTFLTAGDFDKQTLECEAYRLTAMYKIDKAVEAGKVNLFDVTIEYLEEADEFLVALSKKCNLTESERNKINKMSQGIQGMKLMAESEQKVKDG